MMGAVLVAIHVVITADTAVIDKFDMVDIGEQYCLVGQSIVEDVVPSHASHLLQSVKLTDSHIVGSAVFQVIPQHVGFFVLCEEAQREHHSY